MSEKILNKDDLDLVCSNIPVDIVSDMLSTDIDVIEKVRKSLKKNVNFSKFTLNFIKSLRKDYAQWEKLKLEKELLILKQESEERF